MIVRLLLKDYKITVRWLCDAYKNYCEMTSWSKFIIRLKIAQCIVNKIEIELTVSECDYNMNNPPSGIKISGQTILETPT